MEESWEGNKSNVRPREMEGWWEGDGRMLGGWGGRILKARDSTFHLTLPAPSLHLSISLTASFNLPLPNISLHLPLPVYPSISIPASESISFSQHPSSQQSYFISVPSYHPSVSLSQHPSISPYQSRMCNKQNVMSYPCSQHLFIAAPPMQHPAFISSSIRPSLFQHIISYFSQHPSISIPLLASYDTGRSRQKDTGEVKGYAERDRDGRILRKSWNNELEERWKDVGGDESYRMLEWGDGRMLRVGNEKKKKMLVRIEIWINGSNTEVFVTF